MDAYWIEQTESDVPSGNQWLSGQELSRLGELRFDKRRADWRLGRWTAKLAAASLLKLPLDIPFLVDIEIRAAPSGAPELFLFNQKSDVGLSLSHRGGRALCVVALSGPNPGCDLELVESRDPSFVTDFFTANEQKLLDRASPEKRATLTALLWSAKESALKSLHLGLRLDTTSLDVSPTDYRAADSSNDWSSLSVRAASEGIFCGWWRCTNNMVRTVVFNPLP